MSHAFLWKFILNQTDSIYKQAQVTRLPILLPPVFVYWRLVKKIRETFVGSLLIPLLHSLFIQYVDIEMIYDTPRNYWRRHLIIIAIPVGFLLNQVTYLVFSYHIWNTSINEALAIHKPIVFESDYLTDWYKLIHVGLWLYLVFSKLSALKSDDQITELKVISE